MKKIINTKKADYDLFAKDFSSARTHEWPDFKFFEKIIQKDDFILDLGCGNGRLTPFILRYSAIPFGLDISEKLLELARQKYPETEFKKGLMQKRLPYENDFFNSVFLIASFHHLKNKKDRFKTLSEIHRVLKKDGKLAITVWNLLSQKKYEPQRKKARIKAFFNPFWDQKDLIIPFGKGKAPRYYYAFDYEELENLLKESFFEIEETFFTRKAKKVSPDDAFNICIIAKKINKKKICGINFNLVSKEQALNHLIQASRGKKQTFVVTPNPEMCVEANQNPKFKKILNKADLSFADGTGIIWALQTKTKNIFTAFLSLIKFLFSKKRVLLFERSQGSDLFKQFCLKTDKKVFLLGGAEGVAEKCGKYFKKRNSRFVLAGTDSGSSKAFDDHRIIKKINQSGAEVLFVAFGAPAQEIWINRNLKKMPKISFAMGIGGSFDFIVGTQKRAPKIIRSLGLEWFWRLMTEPRRIKRIWNATYKFIKLVIKKNIEKN